MLSRTPRSSSVLVVVAVGLAIALMAESARVAAASFPSGALSIVPVVIGAAVGVFALRTAEQPSRNLMAAFVGTLAGLRVLMQFFPDGTGIVGRAVPATVIVVLAGVVFAVAASVYGGRVAGASVLVGGAFDVAIHSAGLTVDLAQQSHVGAVAAVVVIAAAMFGLTLVEQQVEGPPTGRLRIPAAGIAALGPWLLIHLGVSGNVAFVGSIVGGDIVGGSLACLVAAIAGLAWVTPGRSRPQPVLGAGIALVALLAMDGADGAWAALLVIAAGAGASVALTGALERQSTAPAERVVWAAVSVWLVVGAGVWLSIVGPDGQWRASWTWAVAGAALAGLAIASMQHIPHESATWLPPVTVALPLVVVPLIVLSSAPDLPVQPARPGELMVATYDVNRMHDQSDRFSLSAVASDIAAISADVIALHDVPRGRLDLGSVDALAWLARELDMHSVWAATDDDRVGSAVLARLPISGVDIVELPGIQRRALIDLLVTVEEGTTVRMLAVDVDPEGDPQAAVDGVIQTWGQTRLTVLVGSVELAASSPPVESLTAAGLFDITAVIPDLDPATYPADAPTQQADYIFITPDLQPVGIRIDDSSTGSDHLPIVATVRLAASEDG